MINPIATLETGDARLVAARVSGDLAIAISIGGKRQAIILDAKQEELLLDALLSDKMDQLAQAKPTKAELQVARDSGEGSRCIRHVRDNPYPEGSGLHQAWEQGWSKMAEKLDA